MNFDIHKWHRIEHHGEPVYLSKDQPDWFVPNSAGDHLLQRLCRNISPNGDPGSIRFLQGLPVLRPDHYTGRADYLSLERLNELWFHITNRCNLACKHCLFASSPKENTEIDAASILSMARQAHGLGCSVFVLTGGEPLIHPEIDSIANGLLALDQTHIVVLTNAMNLPDVLTRNEFDPERFHIQISVDGLKESHEALRGKGTFASLTQNLEWLKRRRTAFTLSMCITRQNVSQMAEMVAYASSTGAANLHFMWFFKQGRGKNTASADIDQIFANLIQAAELADKTGVKIDNIESLKTQIFAPRGTIHDGTTTAWESLAMGPDGLIYPSAALVNLPELAMSPEEGLETVWRTSPILKKIRGATAATLTSPFKYLLGGGDSDHSYIYNGTFMGDDPYLSLYKKLALWLIITEARRQSTDGPARTRLRMGEILESCGAHGKVALVHSNCLLATATPQNSLAAVKSYYSAAVGDQKPEILNPVCYDSSLIAHIPENYRFRGYGCGSPVLDAEIKTGEHIVDLGCGSGVECFIAARLTGRTGKVTGIDMLDPMLALAEKARKPVSENLGFDNLSFVKGFLEKLPLQNDTVDVVLSNCVMNLSVHKRRAYTEILRVLAPGGRLVISDVVCETEPDPAIRNDETLRGECIAGAMTQSHLMALLEESGFTDIHLIKRFAYRQVAGHPFYSLTYSAIKPDSTDEVPVIYRGPLPYIVTHSGKQLPVGHLRSIPGHEAAALGDQLFILDKGGNVTNVAAQNSCDCLTKPETQNPTQNPSNSLPFFPSTRQAVGCMACGAPLRYTLQSQNRPCVYCGVVQAANSVCEKGHFVCDACHAKDGLKLIRHVCLNTAETDMIRLLDQIRKHPAIAPHGPEHHALVPGIILSTYRNLGGVISNEIIQNGIQRGSQVAGGFCGFMGVCGAAVGVGVAFSLILDANPLKPRERKIVQSVVCDVLAEISTFKAARCCQRDSWLALKKAALLSESLLAVTLKADWLLACDQKSQNKECLGKGCPLFPKKV